MMTLRHGIRTSTCSLGLCLVTCAVLQGAPLLAAGQVGETPQASTNDPRRMTFPTVEFNPPEPDRRVLENGMVIYLLEDRELPLVTISATMRAGGWQDPPDKVGLATLAGVAMRTGGTASLPAEELDEELERLAANLSVSVGIESGVATLDLLKKDLDRGLTIFADVLRHPRFDAGRVELVKLQAKESIRRRYDQPQGIASREFAKLLFGADHPFARENSVASVTSITRDDLIAFHAAAVHPNGIILGVTGDFDKDDMVRKLERAFGDWKPGSVPKMVLPEIGSPEKGEVSFVVKPTSQTHLRAGHLSLKETDPDYAGLVLLNDILGGGSFRSRLFQDIRTRQGLAYSISSVLRPGVHERGVWGMRTETKLSSTQQVIASLVKNLERLRSEPVSDGELTEAKDAFVNSFIFSFTSPASIVNRRVQLEYDGLPKDFLQQLRDKVMKLTKDDLLRVARAHLHPDRLKILAVGSADAARVLAAFGEAKEIRLDLEHGPE